MNPIKQAIEALERWAALIKHQYSGSSEAMTALQDADNFGQQSLDALKAHQQDAQGVELPPLPLPNYRGPGGAGDYFNGYTGDRMQAYARAAIVAHQARQAVPQGYETDFALMEAHRNAAADDYYKARHPMIDTIENRRTFEAGFTRGWRAAPAPEAIQPTQADAPIEQERLPATYWAAQWGDATDEIHPGTGAKRVRYSFLAERFGYMLDAYRAALATRPAPEQAPHLREALSELVDIVQIALDHKSTDHMDSFTLQPARAGLATHPAPEQVERDREDAGNWRWLTEDCDGDAQDDFIRWLSGNVAPKEHIDARVKAIRAAREATKGGEAA